MYIKKAALCKKGTKQTKDYKKEKSERTKKKINYNFLRKRTKRKAKEQRRKANQRFAIFYALGGLILFVCKRQNWNGFLEA